MKNKIFNPVYTITPEIANQLIKLDRIKQQLVDAPLTASILASLRRTARLKTVHYSTMIEGNRLTLEQVSKVLEHKGHFPGRERDEKEVNGLSAALAYVELVVKKKKSLTQEIIKKIHGLVMGGGKKQVSSTPYRDGQNVIQDGQGAIVYLPPQAQDVADLMEALCVWINEGIRNEMPAGLIAAVAHYQFATIHPYFDGNGRTARLLATLILHQASYDLKGIYSLEEYYGRDLFAYYDAISVGPSHNYYEGRAQADITGWVTYFIGGMVQACEKVAEPMLKARKAGVVDQSALLRELDPKKRTALVLFEKSAIVTARVLGSLFKHGPRMSSALCKQWVDEGFLVIENPSNKGRTYRLAPLYEALVIKE